MTAENLVLMILRRVGYHGKVLAVPVALASEMTTVAQGISHISHKQQLP
jgi:hypothetical protein